MDKRTEWAIYFAGVVAIRLHPKNLEILTPERVYKELDHAAWVATQMQHITQEQFKCGEP